MAVRRLLKFFFQVRVRFLVGAATTGDAAARAKRERVGSSLSLEALAALGAARGGDEPSEAK